MQREILDQARRFNVVCAGRRTGKTELALLRSLDFILKGKPVAYFCPTYKMLSSFFREAVDMYRPIISSVNKSEHHFTTLTGGTFDMWSLDSADTVRGRKYALALIDEAAMVTDLRNAWNAVIRPTLTDYQGSADFYSTPKGLNYFHQLFAKGEDKNVAEWASFRFPTASNPFIAKSEIDSAKEDLPSDVFRQEYLAEFVEGEGSVFRNIQACIKPGERNPAEHKGHRIVAGIDWGQVNDWTAVSVACDECRLELELDRFNKIDWHFQRERIGVLFKKWNVSDALVELNSIGGPNFEELQRLGLPVTGFTTTAQSKPQIVQNLALALEKQDLALTDDTSALRELEAYEAKRSDVTGRITYGAPAGFHDDTVIARALMAEALLNRGMGIWI